MRLSELDPMIEGTVQHGKIYFDCPHPGCNHKVMVLIGNEPYHTEKIETDARGKKHKINRWQASGEFPETLTLTPSIDLIEADDEGNKIRTLCWHGHISNGNVT